MMTDDAFMRTVQCNKVPDFCIFCGSGDFLIEIADARHIEVINGEPVMRGVAVPRQEVRVVCACCDEELLAKDIEEGHIGV
jgi:hypothetical protein